MMTKSLGIFAIIPATVLLAISFFILVVANNVKEQVIKSFGNIIAMLLWVAAALLFITGITGTSKGYCPKEKSGKYHKMMYGDKYKSKHGETYHKGMMGK